MESETNYCLYNGMLAASDLAWKSTAVFQVFVESQILEFLSVLKFGVFVVIINLPDKNWPYF